MKPVRILTVLLVCLALVAPGAAMAKKKKKKARVAGTQHGIGAGGVPALRDMLLGRIGDLDATVLALEERIAELEMRLDEVEDLAIDDDLDGFSENQGDCDDTQPAVFPGAVEDPANLIDDDCDGLVDEVDAPPAP